MADRKPSSPFPISAVAGRYFLYDADTVTLIRREHNILGVLIGSLPQVPQQNVFLGLPLELMPEEARVLVEKGVAYVVDDGVAHKHAFLLKGLGREEIQAIERILTQQGRDSALLQLKKADTRKENALKKVSAEKMMRVREMRAKAVEEAAPAAGTEGDEELFGVEAMAEAPDASASRASSVVSFDRVVANAVTPAISYPGVPLHKQPASASQAILPAVPPSYPLYRLLHESGYFISPGIRFGCHYSVYPGDSLRYHSHFLAVGKGWDEEVALLDLVGGGRLGTGVKKGFCFGGQVIDVSGEDSGKQRAFVIEWAGM